MKDKIIIAVLALLVVISGGTGYYAYSLGQQLEELERRMAQTAADQAAGNAALIEEIDELDEETGTRLDMLEGQTAAARQDIGSLGEQLDGLETTLDVWESRTKDLEVNLDKATTEFSRTMLDASKVYERINAATVRISDGQVTIGSGVIYDNDSHVLTAHHVVADLAEIWVILYDGRVIRATETGSSQPSDIAILRLDENPGITPPKMANSGDLQIGEPVIALGSPGTGDGAILRDTLSTGIVSQVNRFVDIEGDSVANLIQSDVAVNPGNSGGPLYNGEGEIIGIIIARIYPDIGDGISFAVASNKAKRVAEAILAHGFFDYPWVGVGISDITPEMVHDRGLPDANGVLVVQVFNNSPALDAGIKVDDIIIGLDGVPIRNMADLTSYQGEFKSPGDAAVLSVRRGDTIVDIDLVIGSR